MSRQLAVLCMIAGAAMMGRALHLELWDWTWFIFGLAAFTLGNVNYWRT